MKYYPLEIDNHTSSRSHLIVQSLPPLGLYVHYPWCLKKCPYCDFNSHAIEQNKHLKDEKIYLETLILDLQKQLPFIQNRIVNTIFIGGGTPNLMSAQGIHYLLNQIRALVPLQINAEITIEANPGTLSKDNFQAYYEAGVNRVSIGVQSLNDQHLKKLGRIHTAKESLQTLETVLSIFTNVNADLMYALPQQTIQDAEYDIQQLIQMHIPHISAYQLTIEPNTWFHHHPPLLPKETELLKIEQIIHENLRNNHYNRYEISAFSRQNYQCQHNLNYWNFGDYLGIGAGAHGKLTLHNKIIRTHHKKNPKDYIKSIHEQNFITKFQTPILSQDLKIEFMINALRLTNGFNLHLFEQRTGLNAVNIQQQLLLAKSKKFITIYNNHIQPTSIGINFLNNLLEIFI